jgi:acyl-CoA thioesterase-2
MAAPIRSAGLILSDRPASHGVIGGLDPLSGPAALAALFVLDRTDEGWRNRVSLHNIGGQTFGGQIAALGMKAAYVDVGDRLPSAIHVLFLSAPDPMHASTIIVEPIRDGRRLTHRLARSTQGGRARAQVQATLAAPALSSEGPTFAYGVQPPAVPDPEDLPTRAQLLAVADKTRTALDARILAGHPFLDIRIVPRLTEPGARARFWVRAVDAAGFGAIDQLCLLTLISDFWCTLPVHHLPGAQAMLGDKLITTSLDHALWFHAVPDCSAWMLFEMDCCTVGAGVALLQARVWSREGQMLANCSQQALLIADPGWPTSSG